MQLCVSIYGLFGSSKDELVLLFDLREISKLRLNFEFPVGDKVRIVFELPFVFQA